MACIRALVMIAYHLLSNFSIKTYVVSSQKKRHNETVLLSTIL